MTTVLSTSVFDVLCVESFFVSIYLRFKAWLFELLFEPASPLTSDPFHKQRISAHRISTHWTFWPFSVNSKNVYQLLLKYTNSLV